MPPKMFQSKADRDFDEAIWIRLALESMGDNPDQVITINDVRKTAKQWRITLKLLEG